MIGRPKETQQNFQQQIIKKPKSVQITYTSMLFEHWCPNNIHERFILCVRVQTRAFQFAIRFDSI